MQQYASTRLPPTTKTLRLAAAIIEGRVPDMAHGAIQWDAPAPPGSHAPHSTSRIRRDTPATRFSSADIRPATHRQGRSATNQGARGDGDTLLVFFFYA